MFERIASVRGRRAACLVCALATALAGLGFTFSSPDTAVPVGDSLTFSLTPGANYGTFPELYVHDDGSGGMVKSFIAIDLGAVPAGSPVEKATLRLFVSNVFTPGTIEVRRILDPWSESTITHSLQPALEPMPLATLGISTAEVKDFVSVDVTAQVRAWQDGSEPNFGVALVPSGIVTVAFDSKESTSTSHVPELEIVPGVAQDVGVVPSGGIILWSGPTSAIPQGWSLCDGSGATPDLRDRFIVGAGNQYSVNDIGGESFHTLTIAEMPSHTHDGGAVHPGPNAADGVGAAKCWTQPTSATGGGQPHENRPPYYALAYIMKE